MFCQNCGEQRASESVHYCPRCGVKLNDAGLSAKRLFALVLFLVITAFAIFGWSSFTAGPAYMQIRLVVGLIAAIAFYLLFWPDLKRGFMQLLASDKNWDRMKSAIDRSALPPQRGSVPALPSRRVNTAEMVQPPSVTEQTTVLLDKNNSR
jgi:hypothetical protein